jgi:hypothetical protein
MMKKFILMAMSSILLYSSALAQDSKPYGVKAEFPKDYADVCEKYGGKSFPDVRGSTCLAFIQGLVIGLASGRPAKCQAEIKANPPMLWHDVLVSFKDDQTPIFQLLEEGLQVYAKSCKARK